MRFTRIRRMTQILEKSDPLACQACLLKYAPSAHATLIKVNGWVILSLNFNLSLLCPY
jgi:hypothetical protein